MSLNQRYLPVVNAPVIVSKEMEAYYEFYNTLENTIQNSGTEELYALLYMDKKKRLRQEHLKSTDRVPEVSQKELDGFYFEGKRTFRLSLVHQFENTSFRSLHILLASNIFLQKFCGLCNLVKIVIPTKSTLQNTINFLTEAELEQIFKNDLQQIFSRDGPYSPNDVYGDCTCIDANMHYPVDWLFIIDGTRTILKAVELIRKENIKNRMDEPTKFISKMNTLSVKMSAASRTKDAKKKRKAVLREMKTLEKTIRNHAQKHLDLFKLNWQSTSYTEGNANAIINRLERTIKIMPAIVKQAHERIIGDRLVPNDEKILSLYQEDVNVLTRKKIAAEREFGNQLFIAEQADGFIVDYVFNKDKIQHDSKLVPAFIERFKDRFEHKPESFCGDRGFSSPTNSKLLAKEGIFNGICPKAVNELKVCMMDEKFREKLKRRGPNEGRIAIYKSKFSNMAKKARGFINRHKAILWGLIGHNLFKWVHSTILREQESIAA